MAEPIGLGNTGSIDYAKWKKLTPQEIIKEESKGEEIPPEIITWAQQMAAFSKIPDNVTYEQVDGDIGLDALEKLGIEDPELPKGLNAPVDTVAPDAVKEPDDIDNTNIADDESAQTNAPIPGQAADTEPPIEEEAPEDELSLADTDLVTDPEVIRKRKERKGLA